MVPFASHPLFAGFELPDWALADTAPTLEALQTWMPTGSVVQLVPPPDDDLHYEQRIHSLGAVSTRPGSWHDAFNALMWARWPRLKRALNRRQALDFQSHGPHQRSRAQMAITHFDESGVVVLCRDPVLLDAWSRHDWQALFVTHRAAWGERLQIWPVGHALLEHLKLEPHLLLTAKAVAVKRDPREAMDGAALDALLAGAMDRLEILADPQHPRPLPVSGLPGAWRAQDPAFYQSAECFRPLRPGRTYAEPLRWD